MQRAFFLAIVAEFAFAGGLACGGTWCALGGAARHAGPAHAPVIDATGAQPRRDVTIVAS